MMPRSSLRGSSLRKIGSMRNVDQKLVISTYEGGLPRREILIEVAIRCFFPMGILIYGGFVIATAGTELPFRDYLVVFFFSCSTVIMVIAGWNLIPETVEISDYGMKINKGRKTKEATWPEISEIRGKEIVWWMSGRGRICTAPAIVVKTEGWKHTLVEWRYSAEELKIVFISIADRITPLGAVIKDELGWLPQRLYSREKVYLGRMQKCMILVKSGCFMVVIGAILFAIITFAWRYSNVEIVVVILLLFIGGICVLCGSIGYFDERKKLKIHK